MISRKRFTEESTFKAKDWELKILDFPIEPRINVSSWKVTFSFPPPTVVNSIFNLQNQSDYLIPFCAWLLLFWNWSGTPNFSFSPTYFFTEPSPRNVNTTRLMKNESKDLKKNTILIDHNVVSKNNRTSMYVKEFG